MFGFLYALGYDHTSTKWKGLYCSSNAWYKKRQLDGLSGTFIKAIPPMVPKYHLKVTRIPVRKISVQTIVWRAALETNKVHTKEIFMPALSSTMTEGRIVKWLKKVGERIETGDIVMVVESDKADMEVEAFDPGYLAAILVDEGGTAPVGKTVGLVAEKVEDIEKVRECGLDCIDSGSSSRHDGTTSLETVEFIRSNESQVEQESFSAASSAQHAPPEYTCILMPTLSSTMTEGRIVEWLKKEGDYITSGDMLMVVESDKADMEVESFDEGYLAHIVYAKDTSCPVGTTVAYLVPDAADIPRLKQWITQQSNQVPSSSSLSSRKQPTKDSSSSPPPPPPSAVSSSQQTTPSRIIASPYARKIAAEKNISLAGLKGTGEGGRIVAKDVLQTAEEQKTHHDSHDRKPTVATPKAKKLAESFGISLDTISVGSGPYGRIIPADVYKAAGKDASETELAPPHFVDFKAPAAPKHEGAPTTPDQSGKSTSAPSKTRTSDIRSESTTSPKGEVAMNSMQKAVVHNMNASLQVPVFRVTYTVQMDAVEALYKKISEKGVSMSTLLAKASALTLRKHPILNASYGKDSIIYHDGIHIAMAVALPDGGLITPVLKNADQEDIYTLSKSWRDLVKRALLKKLSPDEYSSGTFFISNLGMFGVTHFEAILPPGAGAILAIGASKPVVGMQSNGFIGVSKQMQMTITCDHRHIYGAQAAAFLKDLCSLLEDCPQELTL